jgi:hypothetical protein
VPDDEGVARDVTRDPVPVGDRLDILRTHPKLLLNGLVAENPHYLSPDDHIAARLARNERRRGLGDVDRRIAVQAATSSRTLSLPPRPPLPSPPSGQVPPRDPTLPPQRPGTRARRTGPGRHLARCRDVPQPAFRRGRLRPLRATALLRRVPRQITSDGAGSPESIIDAGEQLGLVMDEAA